jgi:electron transfer flavoprotein alpha subunit
VILVVAEHRDGALNRSTWEAVAAAQQLEPTAGGSAIAIVVLGGADTVSDELAAAGVGDVLRVEAPVLDTYTADGYLTALAQVLTSVAPRATVMAHTYQARDFAPALAARLGLPLVSDVIGIVAASGGAAFQRQMFQGKLVADVRPRGDGPFVLTTQVGAFRVEAVRRGAAPSAVRAMPAAIEAAQIRQAAEPPFREARQAVDLSQAARIVAVGRGIKAADRLPVAQALADALGAELGASRPICDSGWLPMERQIGSSGQTVAPRLYVALGISGAIQHLVGMKGSRTIVAINKDAEAPIFDVADYGIAGDLFEIVPAIVEALKE